MSRHNDILTGLLILLSLSLATEARASCEDLAKFPLTDGKITAAVTVAEHSSVPLALLHASLVAPADFCRISVTLTPSSDSEILAEVWLPDPAKWNGKFLGSGNGGFGGTVVGPMLDMRKALAKGYATAGDDLGHEATSMIPDGTWVIGHPEKVKDFAYRADHVTAEFAKAMIAAYYGRAPQLSYFRGCSNGGHEALMEAQRYPADYDGIIAGAPANSWTHIMVNFLSNETALFAAPGGQIPHDKLAMIQKAVLAKCDALDGVKDGIINDPSKCHFDPKELLCKSGDAPECLTQPQVDALSKIYSGPIDPNTKKASIPDFRPGRKRYPAIGTSGSPIRMRHRACSATNSTAPSCWEIRTGIFIPSISPRMWRGRMRSGVRSSIRMIPTSAPLPSEAASSFYSKAGRMPPSRRWGRFNTSKAFSAKWGPRRRAVSSASSWRRA